MPPSDVRREQKLEILPPSVCCLGIQTPKTPTHQTNADLLRVFRGEHQKTALRLHPLEKALVTVVGLHLSFLPWALGTMHVWSQITSFVFAVTAFVLALWPRNYTLDYAREGNFRLLMWPRLVKFPLTWIGLALLGYVLIQALNPAWEYHRFPTGWWMMKPIESIEWLPQGMRTPFAIMSPWRMLMIYGSAWLLVCALWVGLTRRAGVQTIVLFVIINGTASAILGLLQRLTGSDKMLWGMLDRTGYFFSTIIYKNHAGAYFNLILGVIAAAVLYSFDRQARRMDRSGPAPVLAFCGLIAAFSVLQSNSRAAALLMAGFLLFCVVGFFIKLAAAKERVHNPWITGAVAVVFVFFVGLGFKALDLKTSTDRVTTLVSGQEDFSVNSRQQTLQAGWMMAQQEKFAGWGAGGFRFKFPAYQRFFPEIWQQGGQRLYWEHAHNDFIQTLVELGLVGSGVVVLMIGYGVYKFTRHRGWGHLHTITLLLTLSVTLAHGWMDFPFQNPAIFLTWTALGILLLRWTELEDKPL